MLSLSKMSLEILRVLHDRMDLGRHLPAHTPRKLSGPPNREG